MPKNDYYKFVVYVVNTLTKEETPVCKVRAEGDLNNILNGLERAISKSTKHLVYKAKKI